MTKASAIATLIALIVVVGAIVTTPENYQPCPTEDSTWCIWRGSQQGNHEGSTVINLWPDAYIVL